MVDEVDLAVELAGLVAEAVGGFHDVHPDRQREDGAVAAVDGFFRGVEADPDGAGEGGGVAGEPGVLEIVGGAGFAAAGFVEAEAFDGGGGAAGGDFVEDAGNRPCGAALGGLIGKRQGGVEDVAVAVLDFGNQIGPVADAVVRENGVGGGDFPRRGLPGAEEGGRVFRHRGGEAGHGGDFLDLRDAGVVADAHGHRVARADEAVGSGLHAAEFAVGVVRAARCRRL